MVQPTNSKEAAKVEVERIIPWLQVRILPVPFFLFCTHGLGLHVVKWLPALQFAGSRQEIHSQYSFTVFFTVFFVVRDALNDA